MYMHTNTHILAHCMYTCAHTACTHAHTASSLGEGREERE